MRAAPPGAAADVTVHLQARPPWHDGPVSEGGQIHRSRDGADDLATVDVAWIGARDGVRIAYVDGTTFHVRADSREVWASWVPPYTVEDAAVYLLGPVLSWVLRSRGVLSLHASAVVIDGRAMAFCGPHGAGKSTIAAALSARGFPLLTDDVLALAERDRVVTAWPAFAQVRLWNDSARLLVGDASRLPRITPNWDKRAFAVATHGAGLAAEAAPLGAVFLLAPRRRGDAPRIERVEGAATFVALVKETSVNYMLDAAMRAEEFRLLSRLMAHVPMFRATPDDDPARLDEFLDKVIEVARG